MNLIPKAYYKYTLAIINANSSLTQIHGNNLREIKSILSNLDSSNYIDSIRCNLTLNNIKYDVTDLFHTLTETTQIVSNLLENLSIEYYVLTIQRSNDDYISFRYKTLMEIRRFLRNLVDYDGNQPKCVINKYKYYFDKDNDYKIVEDITQITDI